MDSRSLEECAWTWLLLGAGTLGIKNFLKYRIMNKFIVVVSIVAIVLLLAFTRTWNSPVKGTVNPSNAAVRAWVFSSGDTANSSVNQGNFQINNVKPGTYVLVVEGIAPYRNTVKDGIVVVDGQPTDVGTIEMQK